MIYLINSDLNKLLKSRNTRLCFALNIIIAIVVTMKITIMITSYNITDENIIMSGIQTIKESLGWSFVAALFISIGVTYFASSDNNVNKCESYKEYNRLKMYLSGLIISASYAVVMLLSYMFISIITVSLIWGTGNFSMDLVLGSIEAIMLHLLLHVVLASLTYMVTMLLKNIDEAIVCNIIFIFFIADFMSSAINHFTGNYESNIYWIFTNMIILNTPTSSPSDVGDAVLVYLCFLASTIFIRGLRSKYCGARI